jgi:hypothetical protein
MTTKHKRPDGHKPNCPLNRPSWEAPRYGDKCTCQDTAPLVTTEESGARNVDVDRLMEMPAGQKVLDDVAGLREAQAPTDAEIEAAIDAVRCFPDSPEGCYEWWPKPAVEELLRAYRAKCAEVDALRVQVDGLCSTLRGSKQHHAAEKQRADRLAEYARHKLHCVRLDPMETETKCNCGLAELMEGEVPCD